MTSGDFFNYALGGSAIITACGTFVIGILNYRKSSKIETHTNGLVAILNAQAAADAKQKERSGNVARGGTTGRTEERQ